MALRYVIVLVGLVRVCYVDGFIDLTFYFFSTINDDRQYIKFLNVLY